MALSSSETVSLIVGIVAAFLIVAVVTYYFWRRCRSGKAAQSASKVYSREEELRKRWNIQEFTPWFVAVYNLFQ